MANENETVEQVCEEISHITFAEECCPDCGTDFQRSNEHIKMASRILAAHNREILVERNLANDHIICLQDMIAVRDALIKEFVDALDHAASNRCIEDCKNKGCKYALCVVNDWRALVEKAREVLGVAAEAQGKEEE